MFPFRDDGIDKDRGMRILNEAMQGRKYTWSHESLTDLLARREEIEARHQQAIQRANNRVKPNRSLIEVLSHTLDEDDDTPPCAVCHL